MEAHKLQNKMSGYLEEGINFFFQLIHFFLKLILGWYVRSLNYSSLSILSIPICFLKKWPIFKKIQGQKLSLGYFELWKSKTSINNLNHVKAHSH